VQRPVAGLCAGYLRVAFGIPSSDGVSPTFDMSGRVFKNKPANANLDVPPHTYLSDTRLLIGEDKKA